MRKSIPLLLSVVALIGFLIGFSLIAVARGAGGSNGNTGFSHGSAGGPPPDSRSLENSNGRFAQDRDKGLDRAEDRKSEESLEHRKATGAHKKKRAPHVTTSSTTTGK